MENVCRFRKLYLLLPLVVFCLLYFQNAMIALSSSYRPKLRYVDIREEGTDFKANVSENHTVKYDEVQYSTKTLDGRVEGQNQVSYTSKAVIGRKKRPTSKAPGEDLHQSPSSTDRSRNFQLVNQTAARSRNGESVRREYNNKTNATLCPKVPPNLVGKMTINLNATLELKDVEREIEDKPVGGRWRPRTCMARDRVAIVIPFRDRHRHLVLLLKYLIPMLQRQLLDFWIFVPEQLGNGTFNKGRLMNAAAKEAMAVFDFRCIIFHDVDLIPEDDRNMYSCRNQPFHLSISIDQWKYVYMYDLLVGGVLNLRRDHLLAVNGYSNGYWGWGAEDDDMGYRILASDLSIIRPPGIVGRYKSIPHFKRHATGTQEKNNNKLLGRAARRYKMSKRREHLRDGLKNVPYKLVKKTEYPLFTHLLIDVGTTSL